MSYHEKNFGSGCVKGDYTGGGCVSDVVKNIVAAQDDINNNGGGTCSTSCERSVRDLLSPASDNNGIVKTTIPFILYCAGNCKPFVGSGIYRDWYGNGNGRNERPFHCIESPIFRAKNFVKGSSNCVRLELLLPATDNDMSPAPNQGGCEGNSVCSYFPDCDIWNFYATGICITVDLSYFYAISCLDAVTPFSVSDFMECRRPGL